MTIMDGLDILLFKNSPHIFAESMLLLWSLLQLMRINASFF